MQLLGSQNDMATIRLSPQFLGWIAAFGDGIVIESPTDVRGKMQTLLQSAAAAYRE